MSGRSACCTQPPRSATRATAAPLADTALPRGNAVGDAMFFGATRSIAARRSPVRPKRGYRELKDRARGATASARRKRFGEGRTAPRNARNRRSASGLRKVFSIWLLAPSTRALIAAIPYKIHTVLTGNGIQFTFPPRYADGPTATCMYDQDQAFLDKRQTRTHEPRHQGSHCQTLAQEDNAVEAGSKTKGCGIEIGPPPKEARPGAKACTKTGKGNELTGSARALLLSFSAFGYYRFEYCGLGKDNLTYGRRT
jgi:hypothetical protein